MRVRRCDRCGKDIEPLTGKLFSMMKYYVRVNVEDVPGKEWHYDLCDKCAKAVEDQIKYGPKPKED